MSGHGSNEDGDVVNGGLLVLLLLLLGGPDGDCVGDVVDGAAVPMEKAVHMTINSCRGCCWLLMLMWWWR